MECVSEFVKRKRSQNWIEEDKVLVRELVKAKVLVIENKNTDTNTNKKKKAAWDDICSSFNSMCRGSQRTVAQLKSQWAITKMSVKKEKAAQRRELFKTGGGPPPPALNESADDIENWLPNEFVIDNNEFDSDAVNTNKILIEKTNAPSNFKVAEEMCTSASLEIAKENVIPDNFTPEVKLDTNGTPGTTPNKIKKKFKQSSIASKAIQSITSTQIEQKKKEHEQEMANKIKKEKLLDIKLKLARAKLKLFKEKHPEIDLSSDEDI